MGTECSTTCKLETDTLPSSTEFRDHSSPRKPPKKSATRLSRSSTIFHLEESDVPKWYINGKFVGTTFTVYQRCVLTELHKLTVAQDSSAEIIELGSRIVAGCAAADGPLSVLERTMYDKFCKSLDPDCDPSAWLTTSVADIPVLMAEFEGIIEELQEHVMERRESHTWALDHPSVALADPDVLWDFSAKLELLFSAIIVSAADGLSRAEMDRVYAMADAMNVSRTCAREMCDCLFFEQELFERYLLIFDFGGEMTAEDGGELPRQTHPNIPPHSRSGIPLVRDTTISNLEEHDISPWYLQSEMVGTTLDIWKSYLLQGDPDAKLISTNIGLETGFNLLSCKVIAACANSDGQLTELEQRRFIRCRNSRKVDVDMSEFLSVRFEDLGGLLREWDEKLGETAKLVVGSFNLLWTTVEKLYDAAMLKKIMLMEAIAVCAADGLRREEMDVIYVMAESLGVDRVTTKRMADVFVVEQNLYKRYHELFRPENDLSDDDRSDSAFRV